MPPELFTELLQPPWNTEGWLEVGSGSFQRLRSSARFSPAKLCLRAADTLLAFATLGPRGDHAGTPRPAACRSAQPSPRPLLGSAGSRWPLSGRPWLFPSGSFPGLAGALPALSGPAPHASPAAGRRFENGEYFLWKRREFTDLKPSRVVWGFFPFIFLGKYLGMTYMPRSTKSTTSGEGITQSGQLYKPGLFHNLFTSAGPASLFFCLFRVRLPPPPFFSQYYFLCGLYERPGSVSTV